MSMDLERKVYECDPSYLIAGTAIGIATAVKTAGEDLELGTPVALADGVVTAATSAEGLYGITADSAESGKDVPVFLSGEFFADALTLPEGVTADDLEVAFREIGIFLK